MVVPACELTKPTVGYVGSLQVLPSTAPPRLFREPYFLVIVAATAAAAAAEIASRNTGVLATS